MGVFFIGNPNKILCGICDYNQTDYAQFVADRMKMLELRNQRHALNVQLMEAGVGILERLTPEQWEFVQSQRDSIQATHETKAMERLLEKWSR